MYSQKSAEFTLGVGYTAIDLDALLLEDEIPGTILSNWDQLSYGISGQYFFASRGNMGFGAELMYQYLFWYDVVVPFGSTVIRRGYEVDIFRITPIVRFGLNNPFAFDIGPEFNISDGVELGLLVSANYYITLSDNIDIPLKVRLDIMNRIVLTLPVSLNVGIRIRM